MFVGARGAAKRYGEVTWADEHDVDAVYSGDLIRRLHSFSCFDLYDEQYIVVGVTEQRREVPTVLRCPTHPGAALSGRWVSDKLSAPTSLVGGANSWDDDPDGPRIERVPDRRANPPNADKGPSAGDISGTDQTFNFCWPKARVLCIDAQHTETAPRHDLHHGRMPDPHERPQNRPLK
jgi:hypothetical protein